MENRFIITLKFISGGALLSAFFFAFSVFGYSQNTTHPALTDEIVDFYNASFPDDKITYEEKSWLIKGTIDEDEGGRFFNHFYDPVYDQGLRSFYTAGIPVISLKKWALGDTQKNFYNSQMAGYAAVSSADSAYDFSYNRALLDYAKGDRQRAFVAFGHVLHLLEDVGVPDHTRNDPHPPILGLGSPYEHEMSKWNPENFQIVSKLIKNREKPVALSSVGSYLDRVSNYSNNNFFSKDTVSNNRYFYPILSRLKKIRFDEIDRLFVINQENLPVALVKERNGKLSYSIYTLDTPEINSYILDGYWEKLSKEIVVNGAGALKLFLEEAEMARRDYLAKQEQEKPSFWAQIISLFGFGVSDHKTTILDSHKTPDVGSDNGDTNGDRKVSPKPSPILSPKPIVSPFVSPTLTNSPQATHSLSPSPTPFPTTITVSQFIEVIKIQDGDTLQLANGRFMRLIGIDTPEKDEFYYKEASDKLAELVLNKVVRLEKDKSETDTYGRLLRYAYINNTSVNLELIKGGYARALAFPPDTKYADEFKKAENKAKSEKLGIWGEGKNDDRSIKNTGKVLINEIAWAGTEASANDEWFELYNTENYDINLHGWTIKSSDGLPSITINDDNEFLAIKAGGYILFERTDDTTISTVKADYIYTGALDNSGELLILSNADGKVVDLAGKFGEKWFAGDSNQKISMERIGLTGSGDSPSSWKNFGGNSSAKDAGGNLINGTPKAENSRGATVTYNSGAGGGVGGGGSGSRSTPSPTPTSSPTPSPTPTPVSSGDTASPNDILINEIAWMGTASSANDEWIELRNTVNKTFNLTGWVLSAQDGTPNITLSGSISSLSFFLLERTNDQTLPNFAADQIYSGALGNSGENLVLKDVSGTVINQVNGSNNWEINGDGVMIGNNITKKTAQRMDSGWITAEPTPRNLNSADTETQTPYAVTDLSAIYDSPTITATWTAPNPGDYNTASLSYDLRYSSVSFSDAASVSWWFAAAQVASSSLPSVGQDGASQSATFDIAYEYGQTLYFALKVIHTTTPGVVSPQSNIATVSFSVAIDDDAWAMFGKDQYHTSFMSGIAGPGPTANINWEFEVSGAVSQPVVNKDGDVFFGTFSDLTANLYSVDKTGSENWFYSFPSNVSVGTPAVLSDGTVYFSLIGDGFRPITALKSDGTEKWTYNGSGGVKSITVSSGGGAHFTTNLSPNSQFQSLNSSGELQNNIIGPGFYDFAPVILEDGAIIVAKYISGHQFFNAYSNDGNQLWPAELYYTDAYDNAPTDPSYDKTTGTTYSSAGPKLFSIPSGGSTINANDIAPFDYIAATTVAITTDTLYIGFNNNLNPASGSQVFALNKSDLTPKWLFPFKADGYINKQLAIDSLGNVYLSTKNGKLYGVNSDGDQLWNIETGSNSDISPALTAHGLVWGYGSRVVLVND